MCNKSTFTANLSNTLVKKRALKTFLNSSYFAYAFQMFKSNSVNFIYIQSIYFHLSHCACTH